MTSLRMVSRALRAASRAAAAWMTLAMMVLAFARMLFEPGAERFVDQAFDHRPDFRRNQLVLGLRREFGIRNLDRQHRRQPFAAVVAGQRHLLLLGQAGGFAVARHLARQRAAEARQVRAAIALRDVVGEGQHVLVVAVVPPHGDFDRDAVALGADGDRGRDQRLLGAIEVFDELFQAALIHQLLGLDVGVARVGQHDTHAGIQEGQFAQPMLQRAVVELDHGEGVGRGQEGDLGAGLVAGIAGLAQRRVGDAVGEAHLENPALAADLQLEPHGQRVDDRYANTMQAAGHLVGVLVEFAAGMQLRHDDFGSRHTFGRVDFGRNAAAVVGHGAGSVGVQRHRYERRMAGERLVDGVVDDLVDHVVQARTVVGVADVHAGPLSDRIQALENLDGIGVVFDLGAVRKSRRIVHEVLSVRKHCPPRAKPSRITCRNMPEI